MTARASIFEDWWLGEGGERLWLGSARVAEPVRAEVLLTHGLGEHASRYEPVAERLAAHGLRLHAYDLRGHGRSAGRRGDARRYEDLLSDLERVRRAVATEGRPLFLMGHSFGAQVTLQYLLTRAVACQGAVIASPLLRLAFAPTCWRLALGRLALALRPGWLLGRPMNPEHLSRDLAHLQALAGPELLHAQISARLFFAMRRLGEDALQRAGELRTPLLLLHGGDDRVTSLAATQEFMERAGSTDKQLLIVPEARHELFNDLGREDVLRTTARWIGERI